MNNKNALSCVVIGSESLAIQCSDILLSQGYIIKAFISDNEASLTWAQAQKIPFFNAKADLQKILSKYEFDYLFSITNLQVLSKSILAIPKKAAINFHDSLLPRYAGIHATSWALLNQEERHGITWHLMEETVDEGKILVQNIVEIDGDETAHSLNLKCFLSAVEAFTVITEDIESACLNATRQNNEGGCYFGKHEKVAAGGIISFCSKAQDIGALVRALNFGSQPNTFSSAKIKYSNNYVIVKQVEISSIPSNQQPGIIVEVSDSFIQVATLDYDIILREVFTLDGNSLRIEDFTRKFSIEKGDQLEELVDSDKGLIKDVYQAVSRKEKFWVDTLASLQYSRLPYSRTNPDFDLSGIHRVTLTIPKKLRDFLDKKGAWDRRDVSLFLFISYLIRLSENDFFTIALKLRVSDLLDGLFSKIIPLSISVTPESSLKENLEKTIEQIQKLKLGYPYPLDILNRYAKHFTRKSIENTSYSVVYIEDGDSDTRELLSIIEQCDLIISADNDPKRLSFTFNLSGIAKPEADRLINGFNVYLRSCASCFNKPISELPILSRNEKNTLLKDLNNTQLELPRGKAFHEFFAAKAKAYPDAIAARFNDDYLNYKQLHDQSEELAIYLQRKGVKQNQFVAICMDRSLDVMVGLLAVQKSGAAYVPLDPSYPNDRLTYMLEDSRSEFILTHQAAAKKTNELVNMLNADLQCSVIVIDEQREEIINDTFAQERVNYASSNDLVYTIYTSGSTGKPKGVMITNQALVNFLFAMKQSLNIKEKANFLALTTYCFDIAYLELFLPLLVGGECVIANAFEQKDPDRLMKLLAKHQPEFMQATPVTWKILFEAGWKNTENVTILCGGEPLSQSLRDEFIRTGSNVWNMYGPTETTIWSTCNKVAADGVISIGKPIANTQVYIVDTKGEPVPVGVAGELWIAGDGVSIGYLNRPELTYDKFILNPFSGSKKNKLFRTGDLARWLDDGTIECLGRIDQQVKIRGFRIELGEIETLLTSFPGIKQAVVVVQENSTSRLVAYYIPSDETECLKDNSNGTSRQIDSAALSQYLADKLPSYMIPAFFIATTAFPLTPNGKTDRKQLASKQVKLSQGEILEPDEPEENLSSTHSDVTMSYDQIIQVVTKLWGAVLQIQGLDVNDGFFTVGGDSLLAVTLSKKIQNHFRCEFSSSALFKYSTIKSISGYLHKQITHHDPHDPTEDQQNAGNSPINPQTFTKAPPTDKFPDYYSNSIAIIGISCHFPGAPDHWTFWENLKQGKESVQFISGQELQALELDESLLTDPNFVAVTSSIEGKECFDPDFFSLSHANAEIMSPQLRQMLLHAWGAVEDAGYVSENIPRTSVFVTATNFTNAANITQSLGHDHVIKNANEYVAWLLNQEGTMPTMISYHLGFTGQSAFVHTNCSSSLTALSSAIQSLRGKEVDYSLVGGASLSNYFEKGYVHQPGLNFSSDGHLKAFDSNADGMILGEGVGAVLLKRADDAIRDNDHIYALLRDVGTNNDGANKAGFYAPSVDGQSNAIKKVLEKNNIDPASISYVEAHGTGTALGDPIEIMSLADTYKQYTSKKQFCGIGSVKPNIGHLDTVAGLAGFIKVAMSLYHRQLPPSINFNEPNPQIDFSETPFYVNHDLQDWRQSETPRRAGLSSFGIGGTNTHAVLEEIQSNSSNVFNKNDFEAGFLVPLSAKGSKNLNDYARSFIGFLNVLPGVAGIDELEILNRLSFTLQTGRKTMSHRVIFWVYSRSQLIELLSDFINGRASNHFWTGGQGEQRYDALLDKSEAEEFSIKWVNEKRYNKLAKLWATGFDFDWSVLYCASKPVARMSLPTYPFSKERYWLTVDDRPLNIPNTGSVSHIHPLLHRNTSSFSQQKFTSIFSGKEFFLADHIVAGEKTLPGVAYLEMVRAALTFSLDEMVIPKANILIKNVVWVKPIIIDALAENTKQIHVDLFAGESHQQNQIQYEVYTLGSQEDEATIHSQGVIEFGSLDDGSNILLDEVKARMEFGSINSEACYQAYTLMGIDYGLGHQGVEAIYRGDNELLSKLVLPEAILTTQDEYVLHPCLMDSALQAALGLTLNHQILPDPRVDLSQLNSDYLKLKLPFALEAIEIVSSCKHEMYTWVRYSSGSSAGDSVQKLDIDLFDTEGAVCVKLRGFTCRVLDGQRAQVGTRNGILFASRTWQETPAVNPDEISALSHSYEKHLVIICESSSFKANSKHYQSSLNFLPGSEVILLRSDHQDVASRYSDYALSVFQCIQNILSQKLVGEILIQIITPNGMEPSIYLGLIALLKTAAVESPKIKGQIIQVDVNESPSNLGMNLLGDSFNTANTEIKHLNEQRFIASWTELNQESTDNRNRVLKEGGVYLITGGLGGLGRLFTADILTHVKNATIVLTGRSSRSEELDQQIDHIKEAFSSNNTVKYQPLDIADLDQTKDLIKTLTEEYGRLNGILHCAGIISDNFIIKKTKQEFETVLAAKVTGTQNLDIATSDLELDFFAMFSSTVSVSGNVGQADYAVANAFMNEYSEYRSYLVEAKERSGSTVSINWPLWKDGGMGVDEYSEKMMLENIGMTPMSVDAGLKAFYDSIASGASQTLIAEGDKALLTETFLTLNNQTSIDTPLLEETNDLHTEEINNPIASSRINDDLEDQTEAFLKKQLSTVLKRPASKIDSQAQLEDYGIDSILAMSLTNELEKTFGSLSKTLFFEFQTIAELSGYFIDAYASKLEQLFAKTKPEIHSSQVIHAVQPKDQEPQSLPINISKLSARQMRRKPSFLLAESAAKSSISPLSKVAIIGMSGQYPQANDIEEYWGNLRDGRDCITEVPKDRWNWEDYYTEDRNLSGHHFSKWGGFIEGVDEFDPLFFNISPREAIEMDPQERLFLEHSWKAIEDAGYTRESLHKPMNDATVGEVGVYAGSMYGEYQLFGAEESLRGKRMGFSSCLSSIANRVSYVLDLHGPSMTVDTMCSASLSCIHLACQDLKLGRTDIGIAGGVNITIHPNKYLMLSAGQFLSTKGRCESFGEGGGGYIPAEGVGVVILKRLEDAERDGDHIYGVILASAVNHGGKTNGFNVPNLKAQRSLVERVMSDAKVDARSISYVEAHGTGTKLGDPIEISALSQAFSKHTKDKGFCRIGSSKSNIGHCEGAAGIGGLAKVLLQFKYQKIVPSLHSSTLNPNIDFDATPFIVNQELRDWVRPIIKGKEIPRLAAISSFGAGGSNGHLILEEPPSSRTEDESIETVSSSGFIVPLSAKSKEQLHQIANNLFKLLSPLEQQPSHYLRDLVYTLQVGRESMDVRVAFIVADITDLKGKLSAFVAGDKNIEDCYQGQVKRNENTLTFISSDREFDEMLDKWIVNKKYPKLAELWTKGEKVDWSKLYQGSYPKRMSLPTYPFAKDKYWVVETKHDLFKPVTRESSPVALHPLVHENTSDLSEQRFSTLFTGNEFFLTDHLVQSEKVLPGVAYLEMARFAIEKSTGGVGAPLNTLVLNDIVWLKRMVIDDVVRKAHISILSGEVDTLYYEVYTESDTSEGESTLHSQGAAKFIERSNNERLDLAALQAKMTLGALSNQVCYAAFGKMGLDYGPGHQSIQTLYRGPHQVLAHLSLPVLLGDTANDYILHPSIMDGALQATLGLVPDPEAFDERGGHVALKLGLPFGMTSLVIHDKCKTDMFAWIRYSAGSSHKDKVQKLDIDLCDAQGEIAIQVKGFTTRLLDTDSVNDGKLKQEAVSTLCAIPAWLPKPLSIASTVTDFADHYVVLFQMDALQNDTKPLKAMLPNSRCIGFYVNQNSMDKTFSDLASQAMLLVKEILSNRPKGQVLIQFLVPNQGEGSVLSALSGILKTAMKENPNVIGQTIMCDPGSLPENMTHLVHVNLQSTRDVTVNYIKEERFVAGWTELPAYAEKARVPYVDNGIYLITGGLGAVGLLFAQEILAKVMGAKVILTGRSLLSDDKQKLLDSLSRHGGSVEYARLDVSDLNQTTNLVNSIVERNGHVHGILHCAGTIEDSFIINKTEDSFRNVLAPKVAGAVNLDIATRDLPLNFFALFSSTSGAMGNAGQIDYAAANSFMDQFAFYRNQRVASGQCHGRTVSLNWPLWREGGMSIDAALEEMLTKQTGMVALGTEEAFKAFDYAIASDVTQLMVMRGYPSQLREKMLGTVSPAETANTIEQLDLSSDKVCIERVDNLDSSALINQAEQYLKKELSSVLKIAVNKIDIHAPLEDYGMDSVLAMSLTNQLEKTFGSLSRTLFFEYQTIAELAEYLLENFESVFVSLFKLETSPVQATKPDSTSSQSDMKLPSNGFFQARQNRFVRSMNSAPTSAPQNSPQIAIIGISGRYPQSDNLDSYWENLKEGKNCVTEVPKDRWDWREYYTEDRSKSGHHYSKYGGFIDGVDQFDPLFFNISPSDAMLMDPQERLFLEHAWMAMEDAGYTREGLHSAHHNKALSKELEGQVGVYAGVMYGEYQLFGAEESLKGNRTGFAGNPASIANRVSYVFNLHGPSMTVDTMCSSSLTSIHMASEDLRHGRTDSAIAGGVNITIHPNKYLMLSAGQFISTKGQCESFGEGGDGYIPAEGVGVVVLKRLADAERDGDHIYGVVLGSAVNHGGKTNGYSVPNPKAQRSVIERAIYESNIDPRWVSYIEAHGTGTKLGDPIEITALSQAYLNDSTGIGQCRIGSSKSNIGHCEGAAGISGLSKILLQMKHKQLVPSLHSSVLNPNIDFAKTPFIVNQELRTWDRPVIDGVEVPRIAGISSFGAGGSNAHLIVKEYLDETVQSQNTPDQMPSSVVVPLSAKSPDSLLEVAKNLITYIRKHDEKETESSYENALFKTKQLLEEDLTLQIAKQLDIDVTELDRSLEFDSLGFELIHRTRLLEYIQQHYSEDINSLEFMSQTSIGGLLDWLSAMDSKLEHHGNLEDPQLNQLPINLSRFSYTLQVGREAMDFRACFIVSSLDELLEKLQAFVSGKSNIDDFYQGSIDSGKGRLSIFRDSDELKEAVDKSVMTNKLPHIAELWANGVFIDWTKLYQNDQPKRISLPTYPFDRDRYWIPESKAFPSDESAFSEKKDVSSVSSFVENILNDLKQQNGDPADVLNKYGI